MQFYSIKEKFFFYNFPLILFSLLPFFLITGPFLSDLSISLISILFLSHCAKERNFFYFKNRYFYFFLLFWIYLVFNSLINNFNLDSLKISFFYFRYGVFVIAVIALLEINIKQVKYFFYCIFVCFTFLILDGFYQYFNGENILGFKSSDRISSFFGDEQILGSYLSRLWPIFFGLSIFFIKPKNKSFYLFVIIFILSETLIFLSGDRSSFFYINLSAIFVILFSQNLMKLRSITLVSSLLLLVIISMINPNAKERVFDKTIQQMNLSSDTKKGNQVYIFSKEHTSLYLSSFNMFLDNKVLGVGVKNFRNVCSNEKYYKSKFSCSTHPHNTYLQILAETGIIGFVFLLTIIFYFCIHFFKHQYLRFKGNYYYTDFEICILSGILIYIWPFIPTGNIFNNWLNIIMILNFPFLSLSRRLIKT